MPRQAQVPWYPSQLTSVVNGHDDFRCARTRRKQYAPPGRGIKMCQRKRSVSRAPRDKYELDGTNDTRRKITRTETQKLLDRILKKGQTYLHDPTNMALRNITYFTMEYGECYKAVFSASSFEDCLQIRHHRPRRSRGQMYRTSAVPRTQIN